MILDKKLLIEKGYLTFNLKDLNENLFNEFKKELTKEYLRSRIATLRVDSIVLEENLSKLKEIQDKFKVKCDERLEVLSSINKTTKVMNKYHGKLDILKEVDKYITSIDYSRTENMYGGQAWMYGRFPESYYSYNNLIESLYLQTVTELYKEEIINHEEFKPKSLKDAGFSNKPHISAGTDITLYVKDNYISGHADGIDGTRLCVLLMYLNDDWESGYGGEIVVNEEITIPPLFGNIVILDFTENNIEHEVPKVINENFERFAIIKFFYK